jgi:hypothetical protein
MVEIRYKDNYEAFNVTGCTIAETRQQFKADFSIADNTTAFLNGKRISAKGESSTVLNDEDTLVFKKAGINKIAFLVGALALAMAVTGGVFAYGFLNASATINATAASTDFATVSANTSSLPSWHARGLEKNQTGSGTLYDINTKTSGYTGDIVATISFANADDLVKVYRTLALVIEVRDSSNNIVDINGDSLKDSNDNALLNLNNGSVTLSMTQTIADIYTVKIKNGTFICNAGNSGWTPSSGAPMIFCEIAQK